MKKEEVIMDNKKLAFWLIAIVVVLTVVLFVVDYNREGVLFSEPPGFLRGPGWGDSGSSVPAANSNSGTAKEISVFLRIGSTKWISPSGAAVDCFDKGQKLFMESVKSTCGDSQGKKVESSCSFDIKDSDFDLTENNQIVLCQLLFKCKVQNATWLSSSCSDLIEEGTFFKNLDNNNLNEKYFLDIPSERYNYCQLFPEKCNSRLVDSRIYEKDRLLT